MTLSFDIGRNLLRACAPPSASAEPRPEVTVTKTVASFLFLQAAKSAIVGA